MELLAPAGNLEKLKTAYRYGADAAYTGILDFSLRRKADNFSGDEYAEIKKIKGTKKLYGALNIYFHQEDLRRLESALDYIRQYPLDGFIVTDLGIVPLLQKNFPGVPLHLSTQANCINSGAAKIYRDMGFSRIILGRETPLRDIAEIRRAVPEIELECFVHGAMCLAYSGRCFLSRYMAGRSGNQGDCSHSCRWEYRILEERKRPGEYFPVEEGDGFTTILSSKDLCMIEYLRELRDAGVDSVKIEGRIKSPYYTAVVTRAYRKHLDALETDSGPSPEDLAFFREELLKVSHREFSTGFYFGRDEVEMPTLRSYLQSHMFLGFLGEEDAGAGGQTPGESGTRRFRLEPKNKIIAGEELEFIGPDITVLKLNDYTIRDEAGLPAAEADHGKLYTFETAAPLRPGYIIRRQSHDGEESPGTAG
ncbi:peptidase U32 family protein [Breznakiella homolactica]|uniref:U32 family peptidase n=1 Tax=Breznakiella homolactica TaxID=2798577 RepID=A0A7T7XRL4_9SPIR|nr:U32 family peptidase [Breznakiella homolactica]QQO11217.1 U32 family peptidase [Breznakiella homolactica]